MGDPDNGPSCHPTGVQRCQELLRLIQAGAEAGEKEYSMPLARSLSIHSSTLTPIPSITFEFTVQDGHLNGLGSMHGGCIATLFDLCTSTSLGMVARPGFWNYLGVSRTLNSSYLKAIPVGTKVLVECEITSVGRRMAHIRGTIRRAGENGEVFATCEHGKFNTDPEPGKL